MVAWRRWATLAAALWAAAHIGAVVGCERPRQPAGASAPAANSPDPAASARGREGGAASAPGSVPSTEGAPRPRGLFAVVAWEESPRPETWHNPVLDGVVVRTYWRNINPRVGTYDWSSLDRAFDAAEAAHKRIHLIVAPGFYSPPFILDDPAIAKARFDVPKGPRHKADLGASLPLPWDERYLASWFGFVDLLGQRYRARQGLGYVSITGPNSHNGEVSLPRDVDDTRTWLGLVGGDPELLASRLSSAWHQAIDRFCVAFRGRWATLAIVRRSLPLARAADLDERYQRGLAEYGATRCPEAFGMQTNGLDAKLGVEA